MRRSVCVCVADEWATDLSQSKRTGSFGVLFENLLVGNLAGALEVAIEKRERREETVNEKK